MAADGGAIYLLLLAVRCGWVDQLIRYGVPYFCTMEER